MMPQETLNAAAIAESGKGNANDAAALALTKKVKEGLDAACLANPSCLLMAVVAAQNQPKAPGNTGGDQIAEQSPTNTGGNQQVDPNVTHTGNNQSSPQGSTNTGNTDDVPNVGGNTTTTPVAEQNPDDLVYYSEGSRPENMSPDGAERSGAFNEAKRQSGIPVSKSPDRVLPNVDKRGNPQPGKIYEFDVPKPGGGIQTIQIRDDAAGHFFGETDTQNRGPHFNDQEGNHYDY